MRDCNSQGPRVIRESQIPHGKGLTRNGELEFLLAGSGLDQNRDVDNLLTVFRDLLEFDANSVNQDRKINGGCLNRSPRKEVNSNLADRRQP